jgi:hypothetical protein
MLSAFLKRVPWGRFFLLWLLALLMGSSLLWLHYGYTEAMIRPLLWILAVVGAGLLWATTRPRWKRAHCAWCGWRVAATAMKYDEKTEEWVTFFHCAKCGQVTEKRKKKD